MYKFISAILIGLAFASCHKEDWDKPGALVPLTVDENPALPSLALNGTLLHVETYGNPNDPLLVVIHGGPGGDYRSMLKASAFAADSFFVVLYDQRGSGLSKREDERQFKGPGATQLYIDDLDALIAHYHTADSQKVFLLGHSWGAMLATGYINQHPGQIDGAVLAEPGGFTWPQTLDYLSRSNKIRFFSEALNDAVYPEQLIAGRSEHEVLDYKAAAFAVYENAPGNAIGNPGSYPFWRNGAVAFSTTIANADTYPFDFTTHLDQFPTEVLFLYSENNTAYGLSWAEAVSAPYPNATVQQVDGCGHEMLWFGWTDLYPKALTYLNALK